ncbi:MAG: 1-acyl-sn-glycerol-3-phosphate acyltransferase [Candidatus Omnitrophica bacterium]|nr:1-acyl-sn-glycerol-3-phosphate acyltransferase [Candidatus Omnitrophota bacterium]
MANKEYSLGTSIVLNFYMWVWTVLYTMIMFSFFTLPYWFICFLADPLKRGMHGIAMIWAKGLLYPSPFTKFKVYGLKTLDPKKTYIIIANHQSMLDILVVLAVIPLQFRFVAKRELFKIPFLGWHMALSGYLALERSDRRSAEKVMHQVCELVKKDIGILFFPEGTRSLDGEIKTFKNGAFRVAQQTGVEILPVVIAGTHDSIPKHSRLLRKQAAFAVSIEKPERVPGNSLPELEETRERIRAQMMKRLEELNRQLRDLR